MKNSWSRDIFADTFRYASEAHGDQKLPGSNISYVYHIALVAMEVCAAIQYGSVCDADLAVQCALLHDVMEDAGKDFHELQTNFGNTVAEGVRALTKDKTLAKELQMSDSLERILKQPREIWMVKMADRITNLQKPPGFWDKHKIIQYKNEALSIYEKLSGADDILAGRLLEKIQLYEQNYC
ncbi:MAG TPA: HD domain-containing protein [Spirochaetota bacterium]|nr:HD domain-containing protein [Spirochaetota bacterium]HQP47571.1 HD domain-containing protein [Spirochaetota bacterium]